MTRKIIVTKTEYPSAVPNGTVMTVVNNDDGYVMATVDSGDSFPWFMKKHTFEEYPMKQEKPKTFGEMTPEEKGALLLANHEGKTIEFWVGGECDWLGLEDPNWVYFYSYRVKLESKVETVVRFVDIGGIHKVTFTVTDGVVSTTVKVEKE